MTCRPGKGGRKPTPTNILRLRGTYRHDRHGGRADEPRPKPADDLTPPSWMATRAKTFWRELAPELAGLGLLTSADLPAFGLLCQEWAAYVDATTRADKTKDADERRAYRRTAAAALSGWMKLAAEFGLSPSSRTRLHVTPPAEDLDKLADKILAKEARHG